MINDNLEMMNFVTVTYKDLVCIDCVFALKATNKVSKCFMYPDQKPGKVLYGGKCSKYKKKGK